MTTPNGNPPWTRSADHTFYGGNVNKANYADEPIVNPKTDIDAGQIQRLTTDLAAVTRMANFCELDFTSTGTAGPPTVNQCRLMSGILSSSYAGTSPPAGFPSVTQLTAGVYVVAIGDSYTDDHSISEVFEPVFAGATCTSLACYTKAYASGTSSVYVEAYTSTASGVTSESFHVWIS